MRNKGLLLIAAALVLVFGQLSFGQSTGASSSATAPPGAKTIGERHENQQDRIRAGVKDGQLNKEQASHLERGERAMSREGRTMKAENGGKLSPKDRAKLNRQENHMSRKIYRAKH